jgi:hypothetical protein
MWLVVWVLARFYRGLASHVMLHGLCGLMAFNPLHITLGKGFARCIPRHAPAQRAREKIAG